MDPSLIDWQFKEKMLLPEYSTLQQWGYPDSEGYSSLSPASSIDSFSFSPPYVSCSFVEDSSFQTSSSKDEVLQTTQTALPEIKSHRRNKIICHQRQNASEREKMRMRNLSTAVQNLRRYLPPAVAPIGKNLTKIETLRLTIRYIAHLSDVLGLDDDTLMKRRQERIRSMCASAHSCCQGNMYEICSAATTQLSENFPQYATSPRVFPERATTTSVDINPSSEEVHSTQFTDQGLPEETFPPYAMTSSPVQLSPVPDMKTFPSQAPISPDLGFCQNIIDDMWDELESKKLWTSFQTEEHFQLPHFC